MVFRVRLSPRAAADAELIYRRVDGDISQPGQRWYRRLIAELYSLETMPNRCEQVAALSSPSRVIRKMLYGKKPYVYRIYFSVLEDTVHVLHIRHGARREPTAV